ncbi:MAG: hypothetical protein ACJ8F7_14750 [Gemmataceae bacterium]
MSQRRWFLAAIAGLALPLAALAQPPGGMGGSRMIMGGGDPNQFFNMLSKGKDVIVIDELDDRMKAMATRMTEGLKITNGQITREQFAEAMKQFRERMGGGGGPGAPGGTGGPRGAGGTPDQAQLDQWAEARFNRLDTNHDGVLSAEEMDDNLKLEKEKWDKNGDGQIDLTEYKSYFNARWQLIQQERADAQKPSDGDEEAVRKPNTYRAGKLPPDLPPWFVELDTDHDLQVGVYEWKAGKRPLKEFKDWDRNGDNFITIEEALLVVRLQKGATGPALASNGGGPNGTPGTGGAVMFGNGGFGAQGGPGAFRMGGPGGNWPPRGGDNAGGQWPSRGADNGGGMRGNRGGPGGDNGGYGKRGGPGGGSSDGSDGGPRMKGRGGRPGGG